MKSIYHKDGDTFWPVDEGSVESFDILPAGTYTLGQHPMRGWFFKPIENFEIKGKIYGDLDRRANRILNTFSQRENQTGVLLTGDKGSGKTMLAKRVSELGRASDIPTLVINTSFNGDNFNTLIQSMKQPCIIIFDEFEKVFNEHEQEAILTLLDGVFPTKKLFILTCNDRYRVNYHMSNRPGRIFYSIDYRGLEEAFIREYCEDNLNNKSQIQTIVNVSKMFESFNFDVLKALVEDMNRYQESPLEVLKILNAKPSAENSHVLYDIRATVNGKPVAEFHPKATRSNPFGREAIDVYVYDEEGESTEFELAEANMRQYDPSECKFVYEFDYEKYGRLTIEVVRQQPVQQDYSRWINAE